MIDEFKITGRVTMFLFDEQGQLKDSRHVDNLVVSTGKTLIASLLAGTGTEPSDIGVGTNSSTAVATQTTLVAEVDRVTCGTTTSTGDTAQFSSTFGPGSGTGSLQEAGLFNANTAGTMISRIAFGTIVKGAADTLIINWYLKVN